MILLQELQKKSGIKILMGRIDAIVPDEPDHGAARNVAEEQAGEAGVAAAFRACSLDQPAGGLPVGFEQLRVVAGEADGLEMSAPVADADTTGVPHLVPRYDGHSRYPPDPNGEVHGGHQRPATVAADVLADLCFNGGERLEAHAQRFRHPEPRQVLIAIPVAKPPPHLKEGVVLIGRPKEVTDAEAFEGQSPCQDAAAHHDVGDRP